MSKIQDYANEVYGEDWECALEDYYYLKYTGRI